MFPLDPDGIQQRPTGVTLSLPHLAERDAARRSAWPMARFGFFAAPGAVQRDAGRDRRAGMIGRARERQRGDGTERDALALVAVRASARPRTGRRLP